VAGWVERFHKMREIYLVANNAIFSQKALCSVRLDRHCAPSSWIGTVLRQV
jgi:hypothetical protein